MARIYRVDGLTEKKLRDQSDFKLEGGGGGVQEKMGGPEIFLEE